MGEPLGFPFFAVPRRWHNLIVTGHISPRKLTLLILAGTGGERAIGPGGYVTTIGSLADVLGVSSRSVSDYLRELEAEGLLTKTSTPGKQGLTIHVDTGPRNQPRKSEGPLTSEVTSEPGDTAEPPDPIQEQATREPQPRHPRARAPKTKTETTRYDLEEQVVPSAARPARGRAAEALEHDDHDQARDHDALTLDERQELGTDWDAEPPTYRPARDLDDELVMGLA
jgi:DNA-binding transcriptional MocR family regulator